MEPPEKSPFESEGSREGGKSEAGAPAEPPAEPEEKQMTLWKSPMVSKAPFILVREGG